MTSISKITAADIGVEPALIKGCEIHGLVYFTWAEAPVVGAQCGHCHTILWTDPHADRVLGEPKPDNVPDHGAGYRLYYEDNLRRFLGSLPPCPNCGKQTYDRFVNNVQWCRFSDGTEIPTDITPERIIPQQTDSCLVWMYRQ